MTGKPGYDLNDKHSPLLSLLGSIKLPSEIRVRSKTMLFQLCFRVILSPPPPLQKKLSFIVRLPHQKYWATITWCDLSVRFFVLMLRYCANLETIRYESTSLNRIVADKSHRVIVALGCSQPVSIVINMIVNFSRIEQEKKEVVG